MSKSPPVRRRSSVSSVTISNGTCRFGSRSVIQSTISSSPSPPSRLRGREGRSPRGAGCADAAPPSTRLDRRVGVVGEQTVDADLEELLVLGDRVSVGIGVGARTQLGRKELVL